MKKTVLLIAVALLAVACTDRHSEIKDAARGYLEAMGNYRIAEAAPFATSHTREHTIPVLLALLERSDTAYINQNTPADITIHGVRMLSDTSAYVYYHKHTPITEQEDSLLMLLEDSLWLADVHLGLIPAFVFADSAALAKGQLAGGVE